MRKNVTFSAMVVIILCVTRFLTIIKCIRIKFTDIGEIVIKLSIGSGEDMAIDDNSDSNKLLRVEISDTGVG